MRSYMKGGLERETLSSQRGQTGSFARVDFPPDCFFQPWGSEDGNPQEHRERENPLHVLPCHLLVISFPITQREEEDDTVDSCILV
jgi:hypothetical protein